MNNSKKISLTIEIDEATLTQLEKQLENIKKNPLTPGFEQFSRINSVEELITLLLKQISSANDELLKVQDKMEDVIKNFQEKGVDLNDIFGALFKKTKTDNEVKDVNKNIDDNDKNVVENEDDEDDKKRASYKKD